MVRAWRDRSQSCSGSCNCKVGNGLGIGLQQSSGVPTATPDICAQTQPVLDDNEGIDRYGVGIRVRCHRFPLAHAPVELPIFRLRHL